MTARENLRHKLKLTFRLPPDRPTDDELNAITRDVVVFSTAKGRPPTDDEWSAIVSKHVSFVGKYVYEGLDFQSLNTLFALMQAELKAQSQSKQAK